MTVCVYTHTVFAILMQGQMLLCKPMRPICLQKACAQHALIFHENKLFPSLFFQDATLLGGGSSQSDLDAVSTKAKAWEFIAAYHDMPCWAHCAAVSCG